MRSRVLAPQGSPLNTMTFPKEKTMQNQEPKKLFAFQLAQKQNQAQPAQQWKVREGVAVAGCTDVPSKHNDMYRMSTNWSEDGGIYC